MNGKNKFNIALAIIIIFTAISSTSAHAAEIKLYHKGNAMSSYYDRGGSEGTEAPNGWSTVVISTSTLMDKLKTNGRTRIQAWGRLDTLAATYPPYIYSVGVYAIETKMKSTTAASDIAFDIMNSNPGTNKDTSFKVPQMAFDLIDYKIPGASIVGNLIDNWSNNILTTGTEFNMPTTKNATLTFFNPSNPSLSNNISWKNANQAIGAKKDSGVTAEFNIRILNGVKVNVAPQARVQYGLLTAGAFVPVKFWTNYAYVNHTIN
ncbi:hypothetical protein [Paenibacillus alvei]|uniref:Uncharacterized protein n=1 Tax=Paenibacillus alvei TaxID=44250 RepID=A0AAP7DIV5_PAEAL|nr:hypothetical protein [Paenibacillus alvei]NOJ71320.1 hypothetical protein [Paenibacillus alvei]